MTTNYSVEIIRDFEALKRHLPDWEGLHEVSTERTGFTYPSWQLAWYYAYAMHRELYFVAVSNDNGWVAAAPFCLDSQFGARVLRFIGQGRFDDLCLLVAPEHGDAVGMIARALIQDRSWDALELHPWSGAGSTLEKLLISFGPSTSWISRVYEVAPFVDLSGTWESYLSGHKSSFRKWVKKVERKATTHPDSRIEIIDGDAIKPECIDLLEDLERRARRWAEGTAHFADPRFGAMLRMLASMHDHRLELRVLSSGSKWVAAELMLIDRDCALGLWTTFDSAYDYTGTYVVADALRSCFARQFRLFDFLQGDEEYKLKWATGSREVLQVYVGRRRIRALLPFVLLSIRWRAAKSDRIRSWRSRATRFIRRFSARHDQGDPRASIDEGES